MSDLLSEDIPSLFPELSANDPTSLEDVRSQLNAVGAAMDKCEKMLQYYALGGDSEQLSHYTMVFKQLTALSEHILKKKTELLLQKHHEEEKAPSWKFWK